eukprot:3849269-Pleurochrysis_carterae.AAC.7
MPDCSRPLRLTAAATPLLNRSGSRPEAGRTCRQAMRVYLPWCCSDRTAACSACTPAGGSQSSRCSRVTRRMPCSRVRATPTVAKSRR